jgi:hypothetical protein
MEGTARQKEKEKKERGASQSVLSDHQIKADKMHRTCSTNGVHKEFMRTFSWKSGKNRLPGRLCRCEDYIARG